MIPKIKIPYHPVVIPDNGQTIHIKPYTIEFEKFMLDIENKQDLYTQIQIIGEMLKFCIVEEDFDINELSIGTMLWVFTKCYEISVNDMMEFSYIHHCDEEHSHQIDMKLKIKDIQYNPDFTPLDIKIETEDGPYIVRFSHLKYKHLEALKPNAGNDDLRGQKLVIASCDRMFDETGNNEIELTEEDKEEIVKSLPLSKIDLIGNKISNMPRPYIDIEFDCPACGKHVKEKLEDFFI
jgi:hypothetical protein